MGIPAKTLDNLHWSADLIKFRHKEDDEDIKLYRIELARNMHNTGDTLAAAEIITGEMQENMDHQLAMTVMMALNKGDINTLIKLVTDSE